MSMAAQPEFAALVDMQNALLTPLTGATVDLFVNTPTLTTKNLIADFTVASFTGYTGPALAAGAPDTDANGNLILRFPSVNYATGALPSPAQTINGYYIHKTISAVDTLFFAEYFDTPIIVDHFPQNFNLTIDIINPNLRSYGGYCSVC